MLRDDVVEYLRNNLRKFPREDLRRQLADEGVSDLEFDEALKAAAAAPKPMPLAAKAAVFLLAAGAALIALSVFRAAPSPAPARLIPEPRRPAPESAFLGSYDYVVKLHPNYMAAAAFMDQAKTVETVHFCKIGTDPTNFIDKGLYGPLGIVRLEVAPDPLAGSLNGPATLLNHVTVFLNRNKEKYHVKNMQVSSLKGFEITVEAPFPRLEAYFLGQKVRYSFLAGQDDEIYRDLVTSLRETHSEN